MKGYSVTAHVGVYWRGPDHFLGSYRWLWLARLRARLYLANWPYRACTISRE